MMRKLRTRYLVILMLLFGSGIACAQLTVQLRLAKNNFLAGENVPIEVRIANMSGQDITLRSSPQHRWLTFIVTTGGNLPLTPLGNLDFGPVTIPSGKALVRTVDLSKIFGLTETGNHSVYAIVRLPGQVREGIQSNRHLLTINAVPPSWSQVVGVPGKPGVQHEYRLVRFSNRNKANLFVQVADAKTGSIIVTHSLGEALMVHQPAVVVDSSLRLHVLYTINPKFWGYATIDANGKFLGRELYQPGAMTKPALAQMSNGSVQPIGAVHYDPKAAAAERDRLRKASDRPDYIYE